MTHEEQHIIRMQFLDFTFTGPGYDAHVQNKISELFYERLQPRMEELFDEICGPEHLVSIEHLEIDGGVLPAVNWEQQWVDNVLWNLKQELSIHSKKKRASSELLESFFYFLQYGHLPWNARVNTIREFEEHIVIGLSWLQKLREILAEGNALKRLIEQFSPAFIQQVINEIVLADADDSYNIQPGENDLPIVWDRSKQIAFLYSFISREEIVKAREETSPILPEWEKPAKQKKQVHRKEIFIHNAGLVILHPFLPALFESLNLVKNNEWEYEEAVQTALQVTEYLVSGKEEFPEFKIPLNMILCGMEPGEVSQAVSRITPGIKDACEELLREVIIHWSVLKNTSIEAFREAFLERRAKLSMTDNDWLLQVEQHMMDILLNHLPWGIGVIKLPWMKNMLHVEWA